MKTKASLFIGVTGRAGAGKDTFADMLELELYHHYCIESSILALAGPLKQAAANLFLLTPGQFSDRLCKEVVLPEYGLSPRQILQKLGTAGRETFGISFFTKLADIAITRNIQGAEVFIITDIRYQDEAKWVLNKPNSILVAIDRPGDEDGTAFNHPSEGGIDFPDLLCADRIYHVSNVGTLEDLRNSAGRLAARMMQSVQ